MAICLEFELEFELEFDDLGPRSTWAVDKSVDNVDRSLGSLGSLWGKSRITPFILPLLAKSVITLNTTTSILPCQIL